MEPSILRTCEDAGVQPGDTECLSRSGRQTGAEISEKSLSIVPKSSEAVLPPLPPDLKSPIYVSDFKESILSFSLVEDTPQTSSVSMKTASLPSPSRPLSRQSDGTDQDAASAPVTDLYIFESETQDFGLHPDVAQEEFKGPSRDSRVLACGSEHTAELCCQEGLSLDGESDAGHGKTLTPHAGDAGEPASPVNDAQWGVGQVSDLTPETHRCDNPVELWLDACQYLAGEAPDDVLHGAGHSGMQEAPLLATDLDFPTTDAPVSGYGLDGRDGIGCSDDDTVGRGPPVERWSSVDSWASALSDWTGIITGLPEDLTAAFTEIGAEIDALTQALAEVNAHLHRETSDNGRGQEPAGQPQQLMGVQDQPLKPQDLPDSSALSGQSCLPLCLQDGDGSRSVPMLCDANVTQGVKGREEIQSRRAELAPCPAHLPAPTVSPSGPVASPGGYVPEVIPGSLCPAAVDFGGGEGGTLISNNEDPVILKIVEDTEVEKVPRELQIQEVRRLLIQCFTGNSCPYFHVFVSSFLMYCGCSQSPKQTQPSQLLMCFGKTIRTARDIPLSCPCKSCHTSTFGSQSGGTDLPALPK